MSQNNPATVLLDPTGAQIGTPSNPFYVSGSQPIVNITNLINFETVTSDTNASYLLASATGSLPNSRKITGSVGISITDTGPAGQFIISQNVTYNSASHAAIRQLTHLTDNDGPFEGLTTSYFSVGPAGVFPTASIWYSDIARTKKVVQQTVIYNSNQTISQSQWLAYAPDGVTVLATATDTITYSGIFETSKTRVVV